METINFDLSMWDHSWFLLGALVQDLPTSDLGNSTQAVLKDTLFVLFCVLGFFFVLLLGVILFYRFFGSSKSSSRRKSSTSGSRDSGDHRRSGRRRKRKRRHRKLNPTRSETGGLPPLRSDLKSQGPPDRGADPQI